MPTIKVVDIIPRSLSGNTGRDSEPSLAVNPENPKEMVATAFTPDPMGGPFAPVFVSTDGGDTWVLNPVVPGNADPVGTGDISVSFASRGGTLYAGTLNGETDNLQILRARSITSTTVMQILVDRDVAESPDQPWVVADTVPVNGSSRDRVYVGSNTGSRDPRSATVDVSVDARTGSGDFTPVQVEQRDQEAIHDGPPTRIALHPDGTVYAAFESWRSFDANRIVTFDVVVTRDDRSGNGPNPFEALTDSDDGGVGQRVATQRSVRFNVKVGPLGQERIGADLSIAVDPGNSDSVWIAWCDGTGGDVPTDYVLHVQHSANRGQTWAAAHADLVNAKNPSLAINSDGLVGLVFQQFANGQWTTALELTADLGKTWERQILHQAPADVPRAVGLPYLGDYIRMVTVGSDFYGVFAGNNTPDKANFPVGVTYHRNANFNTHQLLDNDGVTRVPVSIDPFFFHRAA
ncbi:hypothetical protein F7Q99_01120 [Streptomyces kaniharaensis]|uniref:Exo-alpha-sialidase n=1 Tax=Streptomyces kaniharaensis TaxID=212423 RepID=A0A6N7KJK7_9ACTN|nr:hypothetical protein [Streptomyces kaniharaensis]MQS10915.1 hypothetical protein [Streptomyces kaniharaensis]